MRKDDELKLMEQMVSLGPGAAPITANKRVGMHLKRLEYVASKWEGQGLITPHGSRASLSWAEAEHIERLRVTLQDERSRHLSSLPKFRATLLYANQVQDIHQRPAAQELELRCPSHWRYL